MLYSPESSRATGECLAVSSQLVSEPCLGLEPQNPGSKDTRVSVYRAGQIYADDISAFQLDVEIGRQHRHSGRGRRVLP